MNRCGYGRETGTLPTNAPIAIPDDANIHFVLFHSRAQFRSIWSVDRGTENLLFVAHQLEACKESISDCIENFFPYCLLWHCASESNSSDHRRHKHQEV